MQKFRKQHILLALSIIITSFLCFFGVSHSTPDIPVNNLSYPVLLVSDQGNTGSGFYFNKLEATYLITARHVLFNETKVVVPEEMIFPNKLMHKFIIRKIDQKGNQQASVKYEASFYGVMSQTEKDELLTLNDKFKKNPNTITIYDAIEKAINQLFEESQNLELKDKKIFLISSIPPQYR